MQIRLFDAVAIMSVATALAACQGDLEPLRSSLQAGITPSGMLEGKIGTGAPQANPNPSSPTQPVAIAPPKASAGVPAPACPGSIVKQLIDPTAQDVSPVKLTCSAQLPANSTVTRQIVFEGSAANGASLDCNGGRLKGTAVKGDKEAVVVRSKSNGSFYERPEGIAVRNCKIAGSVRIYGMGRNGEADPVKRSSMSVNHTADAQAAAPSNVIFDRVEIFGSGGVPFYVSPGVTNVTLTNSTIAGSSTSVVVYLDAESAGAKITNNIFRARTKSREVIAIDGSAYNTISGNRFDDAGNGGIFAYRNCGEGGTIRHQAPQFNKIENNTFSLGGSSDPAVWLNSRNGNRSYCFQDPEHPFGSSLTPMDMAQNNVVVGNRASGSRGEPFRNSDPSNTITGNSR
ncbi:parallel beta-helix repeat (two copies) [Rhizobium sp. NFR07]|uniref:right-handed parallel beta-helix repeat-containing protein n=1 Tax=Rhizobium sp. NFR07 TaxID=1566262 RepID=UPI0008E87F11|nr:right-handed parallel beta-helix repeat-containing protein [Rhizobium sp. NFR07]SFB59579.1 parallel beta-helix repeat (two copies) [Rhizobium sp. NFR07]